MNKRLLPSLKRPDRLCGPPNLIFGGLLGFFSREEPGHDSDHSPSLSAEVKNEWSHTST